MTKEEMEAMLSGRINALRTSAMNGTKNTVTNPATGGSATGASVTPTGASATGLSTAPASSALTRSDIDKLSGADRLWAGLEYGYNQQRDAMQKQYDKAFSETGRQMLARGMQRSSYGAQTQANIRTQGAEELAKSYQQQASDYASRLTDLENQEWQKQFQQEQFEWQKKSADQELAASYVSAILSAGGTPSPELLARAGISDADYSAMKPAATAAGGGGGYNPTKTNTEEENKPSDNAFAKMMASLNMGSKPSSNISADFVKGTNGATSGKFGQKAEIKKNK